MAVFWMFAVALAPGLFLPDPVHADAVKNVTILQHEQIDNREYTDRITILLGNRAERLLLKPSLVFSDLVVTDNAGNILNNRTAQGKLNQYEGVVESVPASWVRLTTDGETVSGIIDTGQNRHYLNENELLSGPNELLRQAMGLSRTIDHSVYPPPAEKPPQPDREIREVVDVEVTTGFLNKPGVISRVIRVAIVIDNLYDEAVGGRGFSQAISTINDVDGLYREHFGLALKVDRAIILTDNETLPLGSVSLDENLAMFRDYRMHAPELSNDLGLVHLFTGATTTDNASVGLAYVGSACRTDGYDVSMSLPFRYPTLLAAHEIGHNLGAQHDNETEICKFESDRLMHSDISNNTSEEFSSCSREAISTRLEQDTCFFNAIDLDLKLQRDGDSGVIATILNTDLQRAFPAAILTVELKNATVAAAPARCEIEDTTRLRCIIAATLPEQSQALEFELRLDNTQEISIEAALAAEGFFDVHTFNNSAGITIAAAAPVSEPNLGIATSDDQSTGNPDILIGAATSSGGGSLHPLDLLLLLATMYAGLRLHQMMRNRYPKRA